MIRLLPFIVVLSATPAAAQWKPQSSGTEADFRGISAVSAKVAWAGGTRGTVIRTTDGGTTWTAAPVPGAEKLDFRDTEAFSESTAFALSAGPGGESRIYKTIDGGKSWSLQFTNPDEKGFLDAIAFWDEKTGLALGDPVNGRFQLFATTDGKTWSRLPDASLPEAQAGEGAFAASGTCLVTRGKTDVWFGTGGGKSARLFHSTDRGCTWTAIETPLAAGSPSAGIFSIAWRNEKEGVIVGGDYRKPKETGATAARTTDGGKTWTRLDPPLPYRSVVVWANDHWLAAGPSGSEQSTDGVTWKPIDAGDWNTASFASDGAGWIVGPKGRLARWSP
jgi:photosystem II stability/assembly factor-like uncharacterized protein